MEQTSRAEPTGRLATTGRGATAAVAIVLGAVAISSAMLVGGWASAEETGVDAWPVAANDLAAGKFLVASRDLTDPNFRKTVILLLSYDSHGAMGLVINRPSEVPVATVLPKIDGVEQSRSNVYVGGPVSREHMRMLVRTSDEPANAQRVIADIFVSESRNLLERLLGESERDDRFRVYSGYAGWAPRQLDQEVARGGWHIVPADPDLVFTTTPTETWEQLLPRDPTRWVRLRQTR